MTRYIKEEIMATFTSSCSSIASRAKETPSRLMSECQNEGVCILVLTGAQVSFCSEYFVHQSVGKVETNIVKAHMLMISGTKRFWWWKESSGRHE